MISPIMNNKLISNQPAFCAAPGGRWIEYSMKHTAGLRRQLDRFKDKQAATTDFFSRATTKLHEFIAEKLVAPVMNSNIMNRFADKSIITDKIGAHMATAGSLVTTAVYANRTLHKKELDKKRARTLALNQCLVTLVSTVGAYTINSKLDKLSKGLGYKFREANYGHPLLSSRMQAFNIAKQLLIFTTMYRYVAPVVVTPIASKIGKLMDKDNKAGNAPQAQPVQVSMAGTNARDNFYQNLNIINGLNK